MSLSDLVCGAIFRDLSDVLAVCLLERSRIIMSSIFEEIWEFDCFRWRFHSAKKNTKMGAVLGDVSVASA